ncbi:MAG: site-specific integrase [Flavobacteriaceae bacterium]|jgi:integrase|nr:site-specific integrase [Flavobacteriaceae bacterium]
MKNFEVRIYSPENRNERWYVYVYNTETQKIVQKFYKGINVDLDLPNRRLRCEVLKESLEREIKNGWKPKEKKNALPQPEDLGFNIIQAFDFAIEIMKAKLAKKTIQDYASVYGFLKTEIIAMRWQYFDIKEFDSYHIKILLERAKKVNKWSNKRYNKASNVLRSIFTILRKEFIIKNSPAHGIDYLLEEDGIVIDLITSDEQTKIINHFNSVCPNFNVFLKILYQCGIRPNEIRQIKCSMIDLEKNIFILPKGITKTKGRKVPFSDDLKDDLLKFDLSVPEYFLFGKGGVRYGNLDKDYMPSPRQLSVNFAGNMWRDNVCKILKINKRMYWLKHKGANDKEEMGMSIGTVQKIFGHSSEKITEIYATKHNEREFEIARTLMPKFE